MSDAKTELLRGTLDMLILKVVALGPVHGYAIAQRLRQISKDFLQVHRGRCIRRCTGWKIAGGCKRNGRIRRRGARRNFIR